MNVAYFECFAGISGDMALGALLDAGAEMVTIRNAIDKLGVPGLGLHAHRVSKHSVAATAVGVTADGVDIVEDNAHFERGHSGRHLSEIVQIIENSGLDDNDKITSIRVFERLSTAEALVHGVSVERVHLHEAGAMDAIVDVVGTVVALSSLGISRVYSSRLRLGTGITTCSHGTLPVPVPAVIELCKDVPCEQTDIPAELVTPTGAALITTLADAFEPPPTFAQKGVGYGAGKRDLAEIPNLLRVRIGAAIEPLHSDHCILVEANIDDMNPEVFGYLFEILLERGAKDVYLTPVIMKKGRPGQLLSALVDSVKFDEVVSTILQETTSLGVRYFPVDRKKLARRMETVTTIYGPIKVKVSEFDGKRRFAPEYDDCLRVAKEKKVPILSVFTAVRKSAPEE